MSSAPHAWPAERVALLEQLWRDGVTALQIGRHLGTTRNAVIGKLQRLKLLKVERANLTTRQRLSAGSYLFRRRKAGAKNIPIQYLTARSCRWIEADPKRVRVVLYCGARTLLGKPWCPVHDRRAYRPNPGRAA